MTSLASMIDHTLLKAEATEEQIDVLCTEAIEHGFASVCINPVWVGRAAKAVGGTGVKVCTVIGFPLGATTSLAKAAETTFAVADGAHEVDMVINIAAANAGDAEVVEADIRAVVEAAGENTLVKVIIETALLNDAAKVLACKAAQAAGAHFVKTSTGFSTAGATVEDVQLMRSIVGSAMGVKASGGIRDRAVAEKMIAAGANRLGASAGVAICQRDGE